MGKDVFVVVGVGSDGVGDLILVVEVVGDVEGRIWGGIVIVVVLEGGNSVVGYGSGGWEEGEDGGKMYVGRLIFVWEKGLMMVVKWDVECEVMSR